MKAIVTHLCSLVTIASLGACQPVPWGEGASEFPAAITRTVSGIERHLPASALGEAAAALTTATSGTAMRLVGPGQQSGLVFDQDLTISSFDLKVNSRGLALVAQIPQTEIAWERPPHDGLDLRCHGTVTLGPGTFSVALDFATDKLGRITTLVADRADWDGPFDHTPAPNSDPDCQEIDSSYLASLLSRRVPTTIAEQEAGWIARALGFALAAPLDNLGALTRAPMRAHLRARGEQPVITRDGGLSAYFELQIQAETAPCLAPWSFTPEQTAHTDHRPTASERERDAGLFVPRTAISSLFESFAIAGGLCGSLAHLSPPLPGSLVAALIPSWAEAIAHGKIEDFTLEWQPHGPPAVTIDAEGRLHWQLARVDIDIYGAWGGASWRLGTLSTSVDLDMTLEVQRSGAIVAVVAGVALTELTVRRGLLRAPGVDEIDALLASTLRGAVDARELLRLPAELAPSRGTEVLVDGGAGGLYLPTR